MRSSQWVVPVAQHALHAWARAQQPEPRPGTLGTNSRMFSSIPLYLCVSGSPNQKYILFTAGYCVIIINSIIVIIVALQFQKFELWKLQLAEACKA